ncbi:MAG: antitoxin [Steroidobacteraceae bacterium]
MTKRLQVLFDDTEYTAIQAAAASRGMTVAEWVRQSLSAARREASTVDIDRKLAAIRSAVRHSAATGTVERLIAETERGYAGAVGATAEGLPSGGGY